MQHLSADIVVSEVIRARICPVCSQRPPGSDALPATTPRDCEPSRPIFLNLHALETAAQLSDSRPGAYEKAMREVVCSHCTASETAGEFCAEMLARTCPLSRYAGPISILIEGMIHAPNGYGRAA